jgi:hypothetical protein
MTSGSSTSATQVADGAVSPFSRLAVAVDGEAGGRDAFALAASLTGSANADLIMMTVMPDLSLIAPWAGSDVMHDDVEQQMRKMRDEWHPGTHRHRPGSRRRTSPSRRPGPRRAEAHTRRWARRTSRSADVVHVASAERIHPYRFHAARIARLAYPHLAARFVLVATVGFMTSVGAARKPAHGCGCPRREAGHSGTGCALV